MGVALGVVFGAILQLFVSLIGLIGLGFDYEFKINRKNQGFRSGLTETAFLTVTDLFSELRKEGGRNSDADEVDRHSRVNLSNCHTWLLRQARH